MLEPCPQAEEKEFEDRDDTLELVFPLEEGWDITTWMDKATKILVHSSETWDPPNITAEYEKILDMIRSASEGYIGESPPTSFKPVYPIKFIEVTFTIGDKE
jgi:hypothetical protein